MNIDTIKKFITDENEVFEYSITFSLEHYIFGNYQEKLSRNILITIHSIQIVGKQIIIVYFYCHKNKLKQTLTNNCSFLLMKR